jgi:hypothetical protein
VFSREFYQSCADRLAERGLMVQWIQITETSNETLQSMIKTFTSVFPFASVWRSQDRDIILIGAPTPQPVNLPAFLARMSDPAVHADLQRGAMSEPLALLSRQILSAENGAFISLPSTPIHSDYYPSLDFSAQVGFFVGATATIHDALTETRNPRPNTLLASYLKHQPLTVEHFNRAANAWVNHEFLDHRIVYGLMEQWSLVETNSSLPLELMGRLSLARTPLLLEEARLLPRHDNLLEEARSDIAVLHYYERVLMQAYREKRSVVYVPDTRRLQQALEILLERDPPNAGLWKLHAAELAWDRGDDATCFRHAADAFNIDPPKGTASAYAQDEQAPRIVLHYLIESSLRSGAIVQAQVFATQAVARHYLDHNDNFYPPLDLACRKVASIAGAAISL